MVSYWQCCSFALGRVMVTEDTATSRSASGPLPAEGAGSLRAALGTALGTRQGHSRALQLLPWSVRGSSHALVQRKSRREEICFYPVNTWLFSISMLLRRFPRASSRTAQGQALRVPTATPCPSPVGCTSGAEGRPDLLTVPLEP